MLSNLHITKDWTLFLDRDGVINHEKKEDYIRNWSEFKFYSESLKALPLLAQKFSRIIITTNQKGIGKGLMTEADLILIHQNMTNQIIELGGRIDAIYYCTDLDNTNITNKINKKDYIVNTKLGDDLMKQRMDLTKQKLIESKYTDPYAISYFNKEFKSLVDLDKTTNVKNYNDFVLTPDALKYCEDNYLDTENKFCKSTFATYSNQNNVVKTADKIKEQTCLYNNNFITDTECQTYANDDKNYIKFINANNKYCSTNDNIINKYCQDYYKNTENKINQSLIQNNCNNFSSFNNKEEEKTLHNVELESFDNNTDYIFYFIMLIIFVLLIGCLFMNPSNKKNKNNNINNIKK